MRGSRRSKAIALLGSASVLGALLAAAPSVRATAIIDTLSLGANQPWSVTADSNFVYVGVSNTTSYVVKVNPTSGSFSNIPMPTSGGAYTNVERGSTSGNWLYASVNNIGSGSVARLSVADDTWYAVQAFTSSIYDIAVMQTGSVDDSLYVGAMDEVRVLDATSLHMDDSIPLPRAIWGRSIAVVGDDSIIATNQTNGGTSDVYMISARSTDDSVRTPIYDPRGVAVSPDNQWAYVTSASTTPGQPFLYKLSTRTGSVDDSLVLGSGAVEGYAVAVAGDGTIYATTNQVKIAVLPQGSFAQATYIDLSGIPAFGSGGGLATSPAGRAYVGTIRSGDGNLDVLASTSPTPPSPTPATPPGAPTDVVATSSWKSVTVDWSAPAAQGSFPITTYLVKASPGGQVCLARRSDANPTQCTLTNLTPGTQYTFRVQALNGGGWGEQSAASNAATPQDLRITSQQRRARTFFGFRIGSEVRVSGTAPGFPAGTSLDLWIKLGTDGQWVQQTNARVTTDNAGRYSWSRNFGRNKDGTPIGVRFSISGNFSNEVVLPPLR